MSVLNKFSRTSWFKTRIRRSLQLKKNELAVDLSACHVCEARPHMTCTENSLPARSFWVKYKVQQRAQNYHHTPIHWASMTQSSPSKRPLLSDVLGKSPHHKNARTEAILLQLLEEGGKGFEIFLLHLGSHMCCSPSV